jgi:hypothetical protein
MGLRWIWQDGTERGLGGKLQSLPLRDTVLEDQRLTKESLFLTCVSHDKDDVSVRLLQNEANASYEEGLSQRPCLLTTPLHFGASVI